MIKTDLGVMEKARKQGNVIGFTCSTFDLLHTGHVSMLAEASSVCDFLVVGLLSDPTISRPDKKNKPVQSMFERWCQLQAVSYVDMIIPFETEEEIIEIVQLIQPDIRIVGEDYKDKEFTGDYLCDIHYNRRRHGFSSTELIGRIKNC